MGLIPNFKQVASDVRSSINCLWSFIAESEGPKFAAPSVAAQPAAYDEARSAPSLMGWTSHVFCMLNMGNPPMDPKDDLFNNSKFPSNDGPSERGAGPSPNSGSSNRGDDSDEGNGRGRPGGGGSGRGGGGKSHNGLHANDPQELWQINHKINMSAILYWNGQEETAIEYLSKMASFVHLEGKMQPGLAEYAPFH
jgi:hypothetical protein